MARQSADRRITLAQLDPWKDKLSPDQYRVLREKGTEAPFSGKHLNEKRPGMFICAACGAELFSSDTKYDSTTPGLIGWPSFGEIAKQGAVRLENDDRHGMHRLEAVCTKCGSHLGHLFDDELSPTGKHYCINSCSLDFKPAQAGAGPTGQKTPQA